MSESFHDVLLQKSLARSPLARAVAIDPAQLPAVAVPSLAGVSLRIKAPSDQTVPQAELVARFDVLRRRAAPRRERAPGEPVTRGDEVTIDTIAFLSEGVVPLSAQRGLVATIGEPALFLDELTGALVGLTVGQSKQVPVLLPQSFPLEGLRGQIAIYDVTIRRATSLSLPADEDEVFLRATGKGSTLLEVMQSLAQEAREERAQLAYVEGYGALIREVVGRASPAITEAMLDDALAAIWARTEGRTLFELGVTPQRRDAALKVWQKEPTLREDARLQLGLLAVLTAVGRRDKVQLTERRLTELLDQLIAGDPELARGLTPGERHPIPQSVLTQLGWWNILQTFLADVPVEVL